MIKRSLFTALIILFLIPAFLSSLARADDITRSEGFKEYWYSGTAELTSYRLKQARYGEIHDGYAVMIFVTEDFSRSKQVKLDAPQSAGDDAVKVLKLNRVKKFDTGIYRYSMMDSVFTPVDADSYPDTLKLSSSSQEWCGNTYTQLNLAGDKYDAKTFSYFESEGDKSFSLDKALLEDELWTRIRLGPQNLPVGDVELIPGAMAARLMHRRLRVEPANASLMDNAEDKSLSDYEIRYKDYERSLKITFNKSFPYEIESWKETYKSGFGPDARVLTTTATKNKSLNTDYWNKHDRDDVGLRKELGL